MSIIMNECNGLNYQFADYDTTLDVPEKFAPLFYLQIKQAECLGA